MYRQIFARTIIGRTSSASEQPRTFFLSACPRDSYPKVRVAIANHPGVMRVARIQMLSAATSRGKPVMWVPALSETLAGLRGVMLGNPEQPVASELIESLLVPSSCD